MILRNIGILSHYYTVLQSRRWKPRYPITGLHGVKT